MDYQKDGGGGWKHCDMKPEEARERCAGDIVATAQKPEHGMADNWNDSGYLCTDFGSEKCELVPGQKVAAETETDDNEKQNDATHPGHLARPVVGAQEKHAEQV